MPNNILIVISVPCQLIGCFVYHLRLCRSGIDGMDKNEIAFLILGTKNGGKES